MNTSSNNWSFSFYEESFDISDDEETPLYESSKTSILTEETEEFVVENVNEVPMSVYNPFLLTKMNYFKRKSSKVKLKVFDKKVVVSKNKVIKSIHPLDQKNMKVLFWQSTDHFNRRKGYPTEHLLSTFTTMAGCKANKVTLVKEHGNSWYTVGV
ncbi:hypothetical protein I9W82_004644 [Candida metapsilosis]|uniref:Uncharacterized protein n=1 Tax=Candida metapsilosis TaxID=273372 RepID=A0A8H7ZBR2_9ASCO|nr:hypothetical protein I9W82_004644 [Candida metapsilosis]